MNIRTALFILAGGILLLVLWNPLANSFRDTFKTEETRRAERRAARAKKDRLSADRSVSAENRADSSADRGPTTPTTPAEPEIPHLFSSEVFLDSVQAQLENLPQLRGKDLFFHGDIHFYTYRSGRLELEIQNPDISDNLDKYSYSDGVWEQPEPVKTYSSRDFRKALLPLNRIRFSTALKVLEKTKQVADSLNAGVASGHVFFNNWPVFNRQEWASSVTSPRRDYDLTFDMEGNLKSVKKR